MSIPATLARAAPGTPLRRFLERHFYLSMALLIATLVAYGFSHTIVQRLFAPPYPPPYILWVHAAVFSGWLVLLIVQSALINARNVKVHRRIGVFGIGLGCAIPVLGVATALVMGRFMVAHGDQHAVAFLAIPLHGMVTFGVPFALAVAWRRRPEYHRRLMLVATCMLTPAAFGRFPFVHAPWFLYCADVLVLFGALRDLVVIRRVHPVYLGSLAAVIPSQIAVAALVASGAPWWLALSRHPLGLPPA